MLSKISKKQFAFLALVGANLIWGAAAPIFKWSLENIEPFTLAFFRFALAALIMLPFTMHKLHIAKKDIKTLLLMSIFGITINIAFFFLGLEYTSSINAPIIASAGPVFLILGSVMFLHEKLRPKVIAGTVISLLGVIVIIIQPIIEHGVDGSLIGNILFVFATFGAVGHTLLLKELSHKYSSLTLTFWSFAIGALSFLPFSLPELQASNYLSNINTQGLVGILFGAFLSSALAYTLFNFGLKYMQASEVGVFTYMDPIVAIVVAIPLLGETLSSAFLLGSTLVFLGIFIAEGKLNYHLFHRLKLL